jgi:signal transduction histidine kinase/ligand-binding sensor domain-containing protein
MRCRWLFCIFLIIGLVALLPGHTYAAHPQALRFTHLTTAHGLSSSAVDAVAQDQQGFLWVGTQEGLNRYDGASVTVFRHDPYDPQSLSDNWIHAIVPDAAGMLWIGTRNGLNRFDPTLRQFTRYLYEPNNPASIAQRAVPCIYVAPDDVVWACTGGGGISRLDPTTNTFTSYRLGDGAAVNTVLAIYAEHADRFWLGTQGGGLVAFQPSTGAYTVYRHQIDDPQSLSNDTVWTIMQDQQQQFWVGTGNGLNRFDPVQGSFLRYQHDPLDAQSLPGTAVYSLHYDSAQRFWVATNAGVALFTPHTGTFRPLGERPGDPHSFVGVEVDTIFEDRSRRLWFGTRAHGVNLLDPWNNTFTVYQRDHTDPHSLLADEIDLLYTDPAGFIWIGSKLGLSRLDLRSNAIVHYRKVPNQPHGLGSDVTSVLEDAQGTLWVGSYGDGLLTLDQATGQFQRYADPEIDNVNALYAAPDGQLWVAHARGLSVLDVTRTRTRLYLPDPDHPRVTAILPNSDGTLWLGQWDGGLVLFDPQDDVFTHYRHDPNDPTSLSNNAVMSIYRDRADRLWVATRGGGLNRFDPMSGAFQHYSTAEGMPSTLVFGIREDALGRIWVSTRGGLVRLTPETRQLRIYTTRDGLPGDEFQWRAVTETHDGKLLFGGFSGFVLFDPLTVRDNPEPPPVYLTDLLLFNQPVPIGTNSPLAHDLSYTEAITLSHRETVITFGFAALNYSAPEQNQYAYMLEGFNQEWQYVTSERRFATYTNLRPGTYLFRVRAANNAGVWNEQGAQVFLTIRAPFWQTPWFLLGIFAMSFSGALVGWRWRTWRAQAYQRELEQRVAERTAALQAAHQRLHAETTRRMAAEAAQSQQLRELNDELEQRVALRTQALEVANVQLAAEIREHQRTEVQLRHAQKMEAIGRLAGGIAHDFNNLLLIILGSCELMRMNLPANDARHEDLDAINQAAERGAALTRQLLAFSRQQVLAPQTCDLNQVIRDLAPLLQRLIGRGVRLELLLQPEPGTVVIDANQFEQVLLNLAANARDAMPDGGQLRITTTQVQRSTLDQAASELPRAERLLQVQIRDTGQGMDQATQERIFEPFFSTKTLGQGTGLGLATVHGIVSQSGGAISVVSAPGQGTTFTIWLPLEE